MVEDLPEAADSNPLPPMTIDQAFLTLHMHMNTVRGVGRPAGRWRPPKRRSLDELREGLLRKIAMVRRAHGHPTPEGTPPDRPWRGRGGDRDGDGGDVEQGLDAGNAPLPSLLTGNDG